MNQDVVSFTERQGEQLAGELVGGISAISLIVLYNASYSPTFAADLRAILEDQAPEMKVLEP